MHRNCCVCYVKFNSKFRYLNINLQITLEKGECFNFNHFLVCYLYSMHHIKLLGQVYLLSLLIFYPCLMIFIQVELEKSPVKTAASPSILI